MQTCCYRMMQMSSVYSPFAIPMCIINCLFLFIVCFFQAMMKVEPLLCSLKLLPTCVFVKNKGIDVTCTSLHSDIVFSTISCESALPCQSGLLPMSSAFLHSGGHVMCCLDLKISGDC